uniref:Uncharacterized protein n=1 Tax=Oryza nivara TaxID=4536 RepID=A0A0E0JBE7_ORYNI
MTCCEIFISLISIMHVILSWKTSFFLYDVSWKRIFAKKKKTSTGEGTDLFWLSSLAEVLNL